MSSFIWPPEASSGGGGGVTSLNSLTGGLTITPGSGITVTPSGSDIIIAANGSGSGTVTSVALADASTVPLFAISGSPVTTSGTLSLTLETQAKNLIFAGPTTGANAEPTFRSLILGDLPSIGSDTILGNNTGGSSTPLALTGLQVNTLLPVFTSSLNGLTPSSGGGTINYLRADGTWDAPPGTSGGTVTSVGLALPAGVFSISGSPVTTSGTLTGSFTVQNANTVFAGPSSGAANTPSFRTLTVADVSSVAVTNVALAAPAFLSVSGSPVTTTGTLTLSLSGTALPITSGGTGGVTAAAGFNNLSPMTTTGDIIYEASPGSAAALPIGTSGQMLTVVSGIPAWTTPITLTAPTQQLFTTAGSGTYTLPTSPAPLYIRVRMIGGGGGGAGSSTVPANNGGAGGNGGDTVFGSAIAAGGAGGLQGSTDSLGGMGSLGSFTQGFAIQGGGGSASSHLTTASFASGGSGGNSVFGGGAGAGQGNNSGLHGAAPNSGGGGAGAGAPAGDALAGVGGAAGGYVELVLSGGSLSSTFSYTVGALGAAGTAGTSGFTASPGAVGIIIVDEYYQ